MMTKAQIKKAYKDGWLEEVAKDLVRYGTITKDHSFEIDSGYHAGSHRQTDFLHLGINWRVEKHNGEVISVSHSF